ncbi:PTS cellobiose transporter subunit IIC [Melissococcus plutonius]|uniref:Permease IIC component n=1 Tax=Melissococcus plutonius TaxID=33970 RepID=A0A2Z5Y3Z8_9ENTE|nr:PTS cellobiose transporter subunit IIC [Melissococcus plutonius]BAL62717.1 PTS system protein, cellobiose-specific IIC component [Melissococcus plutonius DAT561]MCV2498635.1 PTS cellobiose transporter subunit IIC [Melissococcus plutonius]MCV2500744.1 PTS cellobiose transporter subunit IIC [Melissococcus plutonius]MCV2504698.1 PTS cellobiose transporter subunit IIC [Melissococcus plutonius]MCV2507157.1 PTS cellobiose transporter subunit IIC [Melissococcus plutonius]
MQKFLNWLEKNLKPLAKIIGENNYLVAIRDGFLLTTPLLIVGSLFLLIANFPLPNWNTWMTSIFGEHWAEMMAVPASASFDVMAILTVVAIAYSLGKQFKVDAIQAGIIALVSFFILTPYTTLFTPEHSKKIYEVNSLPLKWMGSNGLFLGMIVALISTRLFVAIIRKGWTIKMPNGVPPTVVKSFEALIPSFVVVTIMFLINWLVSLTTYGNLQEVIFKFLQAPLLSLGNTLGAMVVAYLFLHFFWFFGINGGSVVGAVFNPVLRALSVENLHAFKDGQPMHNIITGQFQDMFATVGGAGSTLSLVIVMIFFCKSQRIKKLSQLSIIPGIFGINEPIIFGLPVVLNPIILIPFVLVPTVNIVITYFAMRWHLVPLTNGIQLPWTTPPIISGFLVSGWQGGVLQGLLFLLGMVIYYPFVKVMDDQYVNEESEAEENESEEIDLDGFDFNDI